MVALQGVANCRMSVIWMLYGDPLSRQTAGGCWWEALLYSLAAVGRGAGCSTYAPVPVAWELAPLTPLICFITKSQESHTSAILFLRCASLHPRVAGSWLHLWGQKWQSIFRLGLKSPQWALRQKQPIYSNGVDFTNFLCKIVCFL